MPLPTRLDDAGDLTLQRQLTKTDATEIEFSQVASRPPATLAPGIGPHSKLRFTVGFRN